MRARLAARRGVPFPPFALSSRDCEHHKLLSTERLRQNVRMFAVFRRYILLPGFEFAMADRPKFTNANPPGTAFGSANARTARENRRN